MDLAKINLDVEFILDGNVWKFFSPEEIRRFQRRYKNPGGGDIKIWCRRKQFSSITEEFFYNDVKVALEFKWGWDGKF